MSLDVLEFVVVVVAGLAVLGVVIEATKWTLHHGDHRQAAAEDRRCRAELARHDDDDGPGSYEGGWP